MPTNSVKVNDNAWMGIVAKYSKPSLGKSIWQIINSFVPYFILWYLMYRSLEYSYWYTLLLSILAALFLIRMFIIFHDCGHGSFFRSKKANLIVGSFAGLFSFTPYFRWTDSHRTHHFTVGNLDKRGIGDVYTMTVEEYKSASFATRLNYRLYRSPWIMFGIGGLYMFVINQRFTTRKNSWKQRINIYLTNVMIAILAAGAIYLMGWKAFVLIQLPIIYFASIMGVYLFYLQHQYDRVIWARQPNWDYKEMALNGSSFLKLPRIFQWFTGSIGYHHVHHLGPLIPNYNLEKCHYENPIFSTIKPMTFFSSLHSLKLRLWDEEKGRIVSFSEIR